MLFRSPTAPLVALSQSSEDDEPTPNYEQDYSQAFAAESEDDDAYVDTSNFQDYADLSGISSDEVTPAADSSSTVDLQSHIPVAAGLAAEWQALFTQLKLAGMTGSIAANCVLIEKNPESWLLHLDPEHSALFNKTQLERISQAINQQLAAPVTLQIEMHVPEQETPALALLRKQAKRQQEAENEIHADPVVLQLIDTFGAIISADSIQPIDSAI